jgi:hypothetical protein
MAQREARAEYDVMNEMLGGVVTNKSKNIGTKFETQVVNYLRANGFEKAKREVLHGGKDQGDVHAAQGLVFECKAGIQAETASDAQLRLWCQETTVETKNAGAKVGVLVVKRAGHGVTKMGGMWVVQNDGGMLVRFRLDEYVKFLSACGWTADGYVQTRKVEA